MPILNLKRSFFIALIVLTATQILMAQEKPKVFFSDDFFLESSPPAYLWFYDQKGILDKAHAVDGTFVEVVKAFAKNCECAIVKEPDEANYVVLMSHYDVVFRPKLAEKKFVFIKVDGEKLVAKGSVRRTANIASDSCKSIISDWRKSPKESSSDSDTNRSYVKTLPSGPNVFASKQSWISLVAHHRSILLP